MRETNRFGLFTVLLFALLSLISCSAEQNIVQSPSPSILLNTPTPYPSPTLISSNPTFTITATSIPSILPIPTEMLLPISDGRVLYAGIGTNEDLNNFGINMLSIKTNEVTQIIHRHFEIDGKQIDLIYPFLTWSPDGHRIAFVGREKGTENDDIYVSRADGTELFRLTQSPNYDKYSLSWSPDGQYILVAMGLDNANSPDLYFVSSKDGEGVKRLTSSGGQANATWSPDGKKIAFEKYGGFAILDLDTEIEDYIRLSLGKLRMSDMSWSPNGEQIAFSAYPYYPVDEWCKGDIFIAYINTGVIINITDSKYDEVSPSWLPDGEHIAFSRSSNECNHNAQEGSWDVFITNASREEQKVISNTGYRTVIAWASVPSLEIGNNYTITELGANLNLRSEPSLNGNILEKLPADEVITVLDGYIDIDDYYWWKIQTQDGAEGWAVEVANWYKPLNE